MHLALYQRAEGEIAVRTASLKCTKSVNTLVTALLIVLQLVIAKHALALPIAGDINVLSSLVYNDRIGNSRFFFGANTDLIRFSAFITPSPDSDAAGLTNNGALTSVTFSHPNLGSTGALFSGLSSGLGGGQHEYQVPVSRSFFSVADLTLLDTVPGSVTAANPSAPNAKSVTVSAPDFDKNALPGFATNMKVTTGPAPTLEWSLPTTGVAASSQTLQIRRIDSETPDRSRITAATLINEIPLSAGTTFAQIPGLQIGQRYEIALQQDIVAGGVLTGRSRTFFEFAPLPSGSGNVAVYLPSVGPNGQFKFDVTVQAGQRIALDPIVAVGYDYQIGAGDPLFASVELPNIGDGLFDLYLFNGTDWIFDSVLTAGTEFLFAGSGVDRFRVLGIEAGAGLDPSDTTAFVTIVSFAGNGRFSGTMTPIIGGSTSIPEPSTVAIIALGFGVLRWQRRRKAFEANG